MVDAAEGNWTGGRQRVLINTEFALFLLCKALHNRNNWLFAGSLRAGKRAAAIMSLIQSAKLNGLNPYAYLRDVLERLPTHPNNRIDELLPHNWTASVTSKLTPLLKKIPSEVGGGM